MKKLILSTITLSVLLFSCQKELVEEIVVDSNSVDFKTNLVVDANGKELSSSDLKGDYSFIVEESNLPNKQYKFTYFSSENEVYNFVTANSKYNEIKVSIDKAKTIRTLAEKTGDINIEDPNSENISAEMKELLASYEVTNKTAGVGVLWDNLNSSGPSFPVLGVPIPGYGKFRNKAESANGAGLANTIHDRTWFRGAARYLLLGTGTTVNFNGMNFRNRAESGI